MVLELAHPLTAIFAAVSAFSMVSIFRRWDLGADWLAGLAAFGITCVAVLNAHWPAVRFDLFAVAALAVALSLVRVRIRDRKNTPERGG